MVAHAVRPNQLVVVGPPGLAAPRPGDAGRAGLVAWLAGQTWLLREPGSGTRAATEAFPDELQIAPGTRTVGSTVAVCARSRPGSG